MSPPAEPGSGSESWAHPAGINPNVNITVNILNKNARVFGLPKNLFLFIMKIPLPISP
jgi:hypothetical protein